MIVGWALLSCALGAADAGADVDPPPIVDGEFTAASVHGIQVLVKRIPEVDFVAGTLFIRGGVRNWGAADQGIEELALSAAVHGGTESLAKDAFNARLAHTAAQLTASSGPDFSTLSAKALKGDWDDTFALLVDVFRHPALPASEIELQREQQLSALQHEQEDPDTQLRLAVRQLLFKGHPYANRALGTPATVKGFTRTQLVAHLGRLRETSRLVWIVAGDVDPKAILDQARRAFGELPRGDYRETPLPPLAFEKPQLLLVERDIPTRYVESAFPGPRPGNPDVGAGLVATSILSNRLFTEIRTKRNLSYAPQSGLSVGTALPLGFLYVSSTQPNEAMKVMLGEVKRLQNEPVSDAELTADKAVFLTNYFMENQTTDGQVQVLGAAQLYWGDWRKVRAFPDLVRQVTAADVQRFARTYIQRLQTAILGHGQGIDRALFEGL